MTAAVEMAHSELRALVAKAARGAGLSWGMAEEAGWAADWLSRRGMPAAEWATLWLAEAMEGRADPVAEGVRLSDALGFGNGPFRSEALPDGLAAPGYLLPFLHLVAMRYGALEISRGAARAVLVEGDGIVVFGPAWSDRTAGWTMDLAVRVTRGQRSPVPAAVIECLDGLALRTTVPPSDQSRRDAGAATADND